ncbi:hypothetical protein ACOSP7_024823 [Xanthoceras sorbifolium]
MCTFAQVMKSSIDSNAHSNTVSYDACNDDQSYRSATQATTSTCTASRCNSKQALHGNTHSKVAQLQWSVAQATSANKLVAA